MTGTPNQRLGFRPISDGDLEFLYRVYASTRAREMARTGWSAEQVEEFLRMQFRLQHVQYTENYREAAFQIILYDGEPAGRLYVDRRQGEIRIIDIALLPEFRRRGIGSQIMQDLIAEADRKTVPLNLHVEIDNPALGMYEQLGFKKVREAYPYYFMERPPSLPG
jgi:ribosomal protein S18 acetylase RimI-like enzyme